MKYITLAIIGIIAGTCSSCTVTRNPDGSFTGNVDAETATAIAAKIITEK